MSKLYDEFIKLKEKDSSKYYLFRCGMFYIFLDSDAKYISGITMLKLGRLNEDISKCGFPKNSLEKYLDIFKNLGVDVEVIENKEDKKKEDVIKRVKKIQLESITPVEAYQLLKELKEYYE